ncbi:hypothetical protein Xoosp13_46 [Xanthomonas phage Xoo-sp13]|nr:hypothetical protein Xoosp13_46 [Xanthomonas phage Xoo-sp13]
MSKVATATTAEFTETTVRGTIAELAGSITINGRTVGQPELSVMTRLGFATEVGTADKPEGIRGPAPKIWELNLNAPMAVARK